VAGDPCSAKTLGVVVGEVLFKKVAPLFLYHCLFCKSLKIVALIATKVSLR
jgi:hypothetical protein